MCPGNCSDNESFWANSKSIKSNPGATVHPTNENSEPSAGSEANQQPAGTMA